ELQIIPGLDAAEPTIDILADVHGAGGSGKDVVAGAAEAVADVGAEIKSVPGQRRGWRSRGRLVHRAFVIGRQGGSAEADKHNCAENDLSHHKPLLAIRNSRGSQPI